MKQSNLKAVALLLFFMGLMVVHAQAPPQAKTVTITLSVPEAETVVRALSKLPYEESAGLIQNILVQANKQLQPPADAGKKADSTNKKKN